MYHKFGLTQYEIINYCMYPLWKVISVKGKSLWVNETERVGGENVFTYTNKFRKTIKFWIRSAKKMVRFLYPRAPHDQTIIMGLLDNFVAIH